MIEDEPDENFYHYFSWPIATKLYTLAQHIQYFAFGNSVIECIRERLSQRLPLPMPKPTEITQIYTQTSGDCALRRLIVLMYATMAHCGGAPTIEATARVWITEVPAEFATDLVVTMLQEESRWTLEFWSQEWVTERIKDEVRDSD